MFKKLFVFAIVACFTFTQANAATHDGLKKVFDDLSYSLTVEWDQNDRAFYNNQMEKFGSALHELQAKGLTNEQLIQFTVSQLKDKQVAADLEKALRVVSLQTMSSAEAHKYVTNVLNQSYSRGASWAGEVVLGAVALLIFVAVAAIIAGKARIADGCYQIWTCNEDCFGGFCVEECEYRCI